MINTVTLTGRLTRDPELKQAGSTSVCNLGLAVNGRVKKGDEWEDRPDFFDVTVFGKQAENCERYLEKGSQLAVAGRLRQDRWQNDAGENRTKVKVIAQVVQFGAKPRSESAESDVPADTEGLPGKDEVAETADESIPF